ncbi:DUF4920 domain-containing protein [Mesoflavibacter sp. SCSIO 43206]|uniref:DUF4920 domain-containing protein n=1 Tax=Mesoflavibacter TaxID=444051 RepID=UPI001CA9B749|nr:DUF4920 domain-containing protein [Mesoflavibacter sp. SCSIO 43206]UAB74574.1 DUF4920 domain-containing protein [Mesoflavibacter sp. SCSIO 43206]
MKKYFLMMAVAVSFLACKNEAKQETQTIETETETVDVNYKSFGKEIMADDAIAANSMLDHYKDLKVGDSINTKVKLKVNEVCQAKGCWMTADLGDGNEVRVTFKDYGFFMPKNISGEEVIVNGQAFVKEMPVEELRHYAEDAGKTKEEIEAITEPKRTYALVADGVLLVEK